MGSAASKTASRTSAQRTAATAAPPRRYPTRAAGANPAAQSGPPVPPPAASTARDRRPQPSHERPPDYSSPHPDDYDAGPPPAAFAARLRQMGIVQPNPTYSPSSIAGGAGADAALLRQMHDEMQQIPQMTTTAARPPPAANTTLQVLAARRRLQQDQADEQDHDVALAGAARQGAKPATTEFLPAATLRDVLVLRARGVDAAAIEARLRLKPGVVARLGPRGLVEALVEGGSGGA